MKGDTNMRDQTLTQKRLARVRRNWERCAEHAYGGGKFNPPDHMTRVNRLRQRLAARLED